MPAYLAIAFALLLAALPWRGAHAHAVLLESTPAANAVLAEAPTRVVLRFNEPVHPALIRLVRGSDATSVELRSAEVTDTELRVPLPHDLPSGSYVLSYRVTSADGHPVAGSFVFAIGAPDARPSPALAQPDGAEDFWPAAGVAARTLWYGSLLLAAGLALILGLLPVPTDLQPPLRRALTWLAAIGLATCVVMLGATGGTLHGGPPGVLSRWETWRIALISSVAASVALAMPGLGILLVAARRTTRHRRWVLLPGAVLALLRSFSAGAVVAVACLLLAGAILAALQLRTPSALIATDYGRLLLLKLGLVVLLLGVGAINRWVLTRALERQPAAVSRLRRTIGLDLALAAGVVTLTAGLGAVPPPRALAERAAHAHASHAVRDYAVHAAAQGYQLVLVATPAMIGENQIDLYLTDGEGQPANAKAAELTFALPELAIEALRADALAVEPGHFQGRIDLPLAGDWQVRADLLVDDFTKLPFRARIVVAR